MPLSVFLWDAMRANSVRTLVQNGERVLNAWCSIASPHIAEALGHLGFDSVTVDVQHGAIDYMAAFSMLQAISSTPAVPFARASWNEPGLLMKLLDSGAYGIICPMINCRADAERFVGACRYPPQGFRSYGPNRVRYYSGAGYADHANEEIMLFAQIETAEAVNNLDEILDVAGLDGVYVGPGDLSMSLGSPPTMAPTDAHVLDTMSRIRKRAVDRGFIAAVHSDGAATALKRFSEGYHFCSMPNDMRFLVDAASAAVRSVKEGRAD